MAKNRRNTKKYPAIDVSVNLKTRYEEISDIASYFNKLPKEAKDWLHSFTEEWVNAKFDHKGKKIHKQVEQKRAIYNRNNARNRDILTKAKACGKYVEMDNPKSKKILDKQQIEDIIIYKIDEEKQTKLKKKVK
jgi:hypothetical protein